MGDPTSVKPVLFLLAAFSQQQDALDWTANWIEATYGPIARTSDRFSFGETDYYEATMGNGLLKQFFALESLIDPARLPELKHASNAAEDAYRAAVPANAPRPLNIDPGYLTLSKLVLASTKNHAHRIYLSDGIYAEITLRYQGRAWQPWPWTYPDYRRPDFLRFFDECRAFLKTALMTFEAS